MDKFYLYKMTTDSGCAPCVDGTMLSLAICKPAIRSVAQKDDIIFGFGGVALKERLIYIAKVFEVITGGKYYSDAIYYERKDCIYRWQGDEQDGELVFKKGSICHREWDRDHDVGKAKRHKRRANVIIAKEFVYFGNKANDYYKVPYKTIATAVSCMAQGHRVNHSPELLCELKNMYYEYSFKYRKNKVWGEPHHKQDNCPPCSNEDDKVRCVPCSPRKSALPVDASLSVTGLGESREPQVP